MGQSTALEPRAAAGLNAFAVIWQGDDATMRIDRIPNAQPLAGLQRKTLILSGLDYRSVSGPVAFSQGYVFSFRHMNTQQVALVTPDFSGWHLVGNNKDWRQFGHIASLDIQDAHVGKLTWQTAESLIPVP